MIEAIAGLADHPFSGWEVSRRAATPRTTVTRIMNNLRHMGLLKYVRRGSMERWTVTPDWPPGAVIVIGMYESYITHRRWVKRLLDKRPGNAVYSRGQSDMRGEHASRAVS